MCSEELGASYVGEDNEKHTPVMLHRAILGSLERFTGILIEHYEGKFPLWLAPIQLVIATITSKADKYAYEIEKKFIDKGELPIFRGMKLSKDDQIRQHATQQFKSYLRMDFKQFKEKFNKGN